MPLSLLALGVAGCAFWNAYAKAHARPSRKECIQADKSLREHLSEKQIDQMVEDSFPASDPLSNY